MGLTALIPTVARDQNIPVQNFSFESPTVPTTPGYTTNVITGWQGGAGIGVTTGDFGVQSLPVYPYLFPSGILDGSRYAYINAGYIFQDTTTALTAGMTYTLTAYVGRRPDYLGATGSISLESFTSTKFTTSFTTTNAQAGQDLGIVLANTNANTSANFQQQIDFDAVSLTQTPAAVPEASTTVSLGLLLVLGLGGMVVAARRKKA